MWVKAWMFKWHNPNLKTGAWPRRGSDHVSESNMGTGMEVTMSVPPSCSQASILGTDAAGPQLLVVPRALCQSPHPEPAAPLLFPGQKFGPLNPHSKFTPTPVHLHPFSQYIWKLTVIYSKASPIPYTQDPHYSCPVSHSPLSPTPSCLASHPQHPFTFTPSLFTASFVLCQTPHSLPEEHDSRWAPSSPTYADISAHFAAAAAPRPSSDLCQLSQPPKLTFSWDLAHGRLCRQAFRKPECCLHLPEVCRSQLWSN